MSPPTGLHSLSLMMVDWRQRENPAGDAREYSRATGLHVENSLRSINSAVEGISSTQSKVSESLARILSTDRLIAALSREMICRLFAGHAQL